VRARLDTVVAAERLLGLRRDQDAAFELVNASMGVRALHDQLAEQTAQRPAASGDAAADSTRAQRRTLTAIAVKQLTARAYAAMARTEPTTVGGRVSSQAGRELAARLAEAAVALAPGSPDVLYLRGDLHVEAEDPENAEAAYRGALAADAPSSAGRTKLAAALRYQGNTTEALAELGEALRIDPTFARAHSDLGMILRSQRKLPEAIAAYREAIRLDADSTDAHNGLAVALATSGRLEDAVAEFREIVRIDPDSTIGYYNLAYALADLDRDVESAAALREVIRINPEHYNARFNLGELFRLEGKYDDSANQFREYLRLAPDTPQNQRNITRARGYIRQFEDPDAPPVPDGMRNR
jgi:tetratricopeptide (TPR) repeat protein